MSALTRWGLLGPLDAWRTPLAWPRHLLIVGPGGLGDTVLTLPVLRRIRHASPATRITWVGRQAYAGIVAMMGVTDYRASESLRGDATVLHGVDAMLSFADLGADFFGGPSALATVPVRIGPASARARPRWFNPLVHTSRFGVPRHEAQRNLRLLLPFGAGHAAAAGELHAGGLRAPDVPLPTDLPARGHVVLHPFSMGHAREWPLAHWRALATDLVAGGRSVVFTGSAGEGERFAAAWPHGERPPGVHDAFGRVDLSGLALLLARADAVVACSTGPLHLAAALDTPVLGLYVPRKGLGLPRWAPLGPAAVGVQVQRRCNRHCQNADCRCIAALEPQRVALALRGGPGTPPGRAALSPWPLATPTSEPT